MIFYFTFSGTVYPQNTVTSTQCPRVKPYIFWIVPPCREIAYWSRLHCSHNYQFRVRNSVKSLISRKNLPVVTIAGYIRYDKGVSVRRNSREEHRLEIKLQKVWKSECVLNSEWLNYLCQFRRLWKWFRTKSL